jgi:hypothetical protein
MHNTTITTLQHAAALLQSVCNHRVLDSAQVIQARTTTVVKSLLLLIIEALLHAAGHHTLQAISICTSQAIHKQQPAFTTSQTAAVAQELYIFHSV